MLPSGRTSHNTGVLPNNSPKGGKIWMLDHTHKIKIISTDGKEIQIQRYNDKCLIIIRITSVRTLHPTGSFYRHPASLQNGIRQQLQFDDFAKDVLAHIGSSRPSGSTLQGSSQHYQDFNWKDGLLFFNIVVMPPWLDILVLLRPLSW